MNCKVDILGLAAEKYAEELRDKMQDIASPTHCHPRRPFHAILEVLEPLVCEIALLKAKGRYSSYDGIERSGGIAVPGVGPILSVEQRAGEIFATRSNGDSAVTWRATLDGGWQSVPNVQIEGLAATKLGRSPESSKPYRP